MSDQHVSCGPELLLLEISLIEKKKTKNEESQKGLGWLMDSRERKEPVVTS